MSDKKIFRVLRGVVVYPGRASYTRLDCLTFSAADWFFLLGKSIGLIYVIWYFEPNFFFRSLLKQVSVVVSFVPQLLAACLLLRAAAC